MIDKYYQLDNMAIYVKSLVVYNSIKYYILDIFIDNIYTKQYNIKTNDILLTEEYIVINEVKFISNYYQ